jgi:UDP-N-acetylmuramoyl-L-alanyl-D-glutamate--2,6-diaminopimelate ligase
MAAVAQAQADTVIVTDDNPRGEDGDAIVVDILAGFGASTQPSVERDRARAIVQAIAQAKVGDTVLIAGKGHESYQEIAGIKIPFDDRRVASAALGLPT